RRLGDRPHPHGRWRAHRDVTALASRSRCSIMRPRMGDEAMSEPIMTWLAVRAVRWIAWIGFFGYSLHFMLYPQSHVNSFGHLYYMTEAGMFGFGLIALFAGFLELMTRERAGLVRPAFGQLIPAKGNTKIAERG